MIKNIFTNSAGILVSRILGFLRDMMTANILGANVYSDIFFIAFKIPNLFRTIFAEGAFTQAFIPAFSRSKFKVRFSTIIFTRKKLLSQHNIEYVTIEGNESLWEEIFSELYKREIQSIIIEGGAAILQDCISKKIWDEMRVFIGPLNFIKGIAAPQVLENPTEKITIGNSNLLYYRKI